MEFKTYMAARSKLEYKGFAIGIWGADYMDPFTFLNLFTDAGRRQRQRLVGPEICGRCSTKRIARWISQKRYELLAKAEKYMLDAQPVIPIETPSVNWVKKPYVKGMYPNAASLFAWKFVYIERDQSKWDYGTPSLT